MWLPPSFLVFLAVYAGIVNNYSLGRYIRYNAMQAVLLDILLIIPQVAGGGEGVWGRGGWGVWMGAAVAMCGVCDEGEGVLPLCVRRRAAPLRHPRHVCPTDKKTTCLLECLAVFDHV